MRPHLKFKGNKFLQILMNFNKILSKFVWDAMEMMIFLVNCYRNFIQIDEKIIVEEK